MNISRKGQKIKVVFNYYCLKNKCYLKLNLQIMYISVDIANDNVINKDLIIISKIKFDSMFRLFILKNGA